eukprot:8405910-Ditylum_brightwellii.AAC.1
MEILAAMSAKAKWALTSCLKKLALKDFDCEDIDIVSAIILVIAISIYKTCSVENFQHLFQTLSDQVRISGKELTPKEVCKIAEHNYHTMKLAGEWDSFSGKVLLSENKPMEKETEKTGKDEQQTHTGPRFQPPTSGRPDWKFIHGKNLTYFTKKIEGMNVEGFFDNATVNGHQWSVGKHSKTSESRTEGAPSETQPAEWVASVPKQDISWAIMLLDCM